MCLKFGGRVSSVLRGIHNLEKRVSEALELSRFKKLLPRHLKLVNNALVFVWLILREKLLLRELRIPDDTATHEDQRYTKTALCYLYILKSEDWTINAIAIDVTTYRDILYV